jgi:hypothetical protein
MQRRNFLRNRYARRGEKMGPVEASITIEDLVEAAPESVRYLIDKGLPCIVCGQPAWGTLEKMAMARGRSAADIGEIVSDINALIERGVSR